MAGWTQTPNFIYDLMPDMKEAEMKVVMAVVRQTAGWQTERVKLRMADFEQITGLTRPSVNTGIKAALERGVLSRETDGESFIYWLSEPCTDALIVKNFNHETVNEVQELPSDSKNSLPSAVKNSNSETVKNLNSNKRNINTNKPKKKDTATQPAQRDKSPTPQQEFFGAVCEAIGWDHKTLSKDDKGQVAQAVGILTKANYTVDDIRRFMTEIWFIDWRWKDKGQFPTLKQLRQEIGKIRSMVPAAAPPAKAKGIEGFRGMLAEQGISI